MARFEMESIANICSPYKEKFGIPRQPNLVESSLSQISFDLTQENRECCKYLETFSHIWLFYVFHENAGRWKARVRPPRLGGNKSVGVFASRSPFRPNAIGFSVVKLERIFEEKKKLILEISGGDLLDGTPILDIKPYISYSDSVPEANKGWLEDHEWSFLDVSFTVEAERSLQKSELKYPHLRALIEDVLGQDPRPAYKRDDYAKVYAFRLYDFDIKWKVEGNRCEVLKIVSSHKRYASKDQNA